MDDTADFSSLHQLMESLSLWCALHCIYTHFVIDCLRVYSKADLIDGGTDIHIETHL